MLRRALSVPNTITFLPEKLPTDNEKIPRTLNPTPFKNKNIYRDLDLSPILQHQVNNLIMQIYFLDPLAINLCHRQHTYLLYFHD